ncbi:MAG: radical SAM family heme chaperone HemW [Ruminococcaceae bacterium]|nr:radical SAM family heme chaperone HemW [Oscillospiraceae bacterium]
MIFEGSVNNNFLGIYIHIPFCIKKCNYCDFCSFPDSEENLIDAYVNELIRRINNFYAQHGKRKVDTVYFGGGTPTLMSGKQFERILNALRNSFDISDDAEITAECNPASIDLNGLSKLHELGINRLSIGLQSANDEELKLLGRLHNFEDFCGTFYSARNVGFDNVSVDLMYGIPAQTKESFSETLLKVVELRPEHISAYGLKIEEGTAFYRNRDKLTLPDEDTEADLYTFCCEFLEQNGYNRYEISNFAISGRESRHNLKYWKLDDYVGFGVAAHSRFEGERFGNSRDISAFLEGKDIVCEKQKISKNVFLTEFVMLGLRLFEGIDKNEFFSIAKKDFKSAYPMVNSYIKSGFMTENESKIAFTTKGFLVSNAILAQMLDFDE